MTELRFWCVDETEFVIAPTAEKALEYGRDALEERDCETADLDLASVELWPHEREFTFIGDAGDVMKTAAEWCAERPEGHFATTEY